MPPEDRAPGGWLADELYWDGVFSSLLDRVSTLRTTRSGGLGGAARSLAIASVHRLAGPTVVVAPSPREAESLRDDLRAITGEVLYFPQYDMLPYEGEPAHPGVVADRVECMAGLSSGRAGTIVVVPAQALVKKIPPPARFERLRVYRGMQIEMNALGSWLVSAGYAREDSVYEQGRWALRGGVIDVGSFGLDNPVRLEFAGDEVESLRIFDQRSQRSIREVQSVTLLPAREVFLPPEAWDAALERLGDGHVLEPLLMSSTSFPGIEHHLPVFMDGLSSLLDYLPSIGTVVLVEPDRIRESMESSHAVLRESFPGSLPFGFGDQFFEPDQVLAALAACPRSLVMELAPSSDVDCYTHTMPQESFLGHPEEMMRLFAQWRSEGYRIGICCDTPAEAETFRSLLPPALESSVSVDVASLSEGFRMPEERIAVLVERRLLSGRRRPGIVRRFRGGEAVSSVDDLPPGSLVVHRQYGVGLFRGLERVESGGEILDCLAIEYADGDRLLIPVSEVGQVHRYMVPGDASPQLDRIGTGQWNAKVSRARARAGEIAGRLAVIYAERMARRREPLGPAGHLMETLERTFPFEETPDQQEAIDRTKRDFLSDTPMDRLVCGDVGYGKTEVALRAAFRMAEAGRQVAVMVPTTILAEQHYQTFRDRLAEFPVKVACLSRFQDRETRRKVLEELAEGTAGIVIGTHMLLSKDVRFNRLGLVIIDEEHRFGVRQKEYLREMRTSVDTLSMTATPIPRTLHMALSGFRDISIIATPPRDRYPIHTELVTFNRRVIQTAIQRELEREGQVFFVHNRIHTLEKVRAELAGFLGGVRIATAHGQMKPEQLEDVMSSFMQGDCDVLLSTAIIESGLDLPRVNTIFIDNAHTFGMADLYQLRGRVGRSYLRAYCYLIHPAGRAGMSPEARNRLESIQRFTELGSGWHMAMRDLEIRGAGEFLGARQHGHIESIGYSMFESLIREEAERLSGSAGDAVQQVRIELPMEAFLPEDYMPDVVERVRLYRYVWRAGSESEIEDWKGFVRDRFGDPPEQVVNCAERARIHLLARGAGAEEVIGSGRSVRIVLGPGRGAQASKALSGRPGLSIRHEKTGRMVIGIDCAGPGETTGSVTSILRLLA
ncbi:MAG: transcription-repair coupling factor [Candidatus Fermentibacter sp.]|nr:transcription-repair coupling factor [Candidatus Fermentibacter sp.]